MNDSIDAAEPAGPAPRLRLENFATRTLGPLALEIARDECIALSGPSGSGKSLLLRAIADLDPHQGEAFLDGEPCSRMPPPRWRRQVALLAAESPWWLPRVGDHFCRAQPQGLQELGFGTDVLDWQVERLSSGERQRLALLRLLCNRPKVLLLDEPTANLDPGTTAAVEDLVQRYRSLHGAGVLWVSHDPEQIRRVAQRALVIRGRVLEAP